MLRTSTRPPACWISRKRSAQDFGAKFFRPISRVSASKSSGWVASGCKAGALAATSIGSDIDHRIFRDRAGRDPAMQLGMSGREDAFRLVGPLRSTVILSAAKETRCGLRGVPRRLICASDQFARHLRRLADIGDGYRPVDFRDQQGRLIDLHRCGDLRRRKLHRRLRLSAIPHRPWCSEIRCGTESRRDFGRRRYKFGRRAARARSSRRSGRAHRRPRRTRTQHQPAARMTRTRVGMSQPIDRRRGAL